MTGIIEIFEVIFLLPWAIVILLTPITLISLLWRIISETWF